MSRTNKDKPKEIRFPRYWKERHERELGRKEEDTEWHWQRGTPREWDLLVHYAPRRRAARDWEHKIIGVEFDRIILDEIDEVPHLESNKPHKYYY